MYKAGGMFHDKNTKDYKEYFLIGQYGKISKFSAICLSKVTNGQIDSISKNKEGNLNSSLSVAAKMEVEQEANHQKFANYFAISH